MVADNPDVELPALVRDGQLLLNRAEEYCLLDRLPLVVGTVSGHRDGFGFLLPEDGGDDVFLPFRQMRQLMHGDRAAVRVTGTLAPGAELEFEMPSATPAPMP